MKLELKKVLWKDVKECRGGNGKKLYIIRCTVDGAGEVQLKAFDQVMADKVTAGAVLDVSKDERAQENDPPSFLMTAPRKNGYGQRHSGAAPAMDKMQFLMDQRAKLAMCALTQAREHAGAHLTASGHEEKIIPLADKMLKWLQEKSLLDMEEQKVKA